MGGVASPPIPCNRSDRSKSTLKERRRFVRAYSAETPATTPQCDFPAFFRIGVRSRSTPLYSLNLTLQLSENEAHRTSNPSCQAARHLPQLHLGRAYAFLHLPSTLAAVRGGLSINAGAKRVWSPHHCFPQMSSLLSSCTVRRSRFHFVFCSNHLPCTSTPSGGPRR
ncbi:hypothetical protein OH77DRAFT_151099 [Trametes cingulata]|nr:hypothetical protein OH77DRAFT_151099 [Trametes cingulata]